ncbi:MAG TPA: SpoIIE family protein phosphatase [Bryobacteraceae bacterium]|nr:SpoIIE family protein phosphatase [Bryobacteraceae bacterium]
MEEKPVRILIVDDEPDIELLIRQRFKRRSGEFEFVFAANGQEALERLQEHPELEVVVTDINMPVMDGLTLLSRLGATNRLLKAVILSAYGDMPNIRTAMNRGAFDFLTKPIDFQDFETTIRKTVHEVETARQGEQARVQLLALRQELEIASRIQQSLLPRHFPAFPERSEFDLYAEMAPARQVGGDFYDFFLIDDERLGFVIGDVSGKGVPAALFMAVSRTLLRATAMQGVSPAECLAYMNRVLGRQAEEGVYVTMFYGVFHTATGEVEYAIGGHNPPFVLRRGGELIELTEPAGMVVGLLPDMKYENGRLQLEPGEAILLYTDGVTEAQDEAEKFYSERRLREVLRNMGPQTPEAMIRGVLEDVERFSGGAAQADDVTMLALKRSG